jgi:predicted PurR-regulated permease PerM
MPLPPPSKQQARIIWAALTGLAIAAILSLLVALVWGLGRVLAVFGPVVWPLAIAGVLAYLLDPVVDWFERRRVPRARAVMLVFVLALLLVAGVLGSVVPQVVVELKQLGSDIPGYAQTIHLKVNNWIKHPPAIFSQLLGGFSATNAPAAVTETNTVPDPISAPETNAPAATATNVALLIQVLGGDTNRLLLTVPTAPQPAPGDTGAPFLNSLLTMDNVKTATSFVSKAASSVGSWLVGQAGKVTSLFGVLFGILAGLALVPIYLFYFLLEKRGIQATWTDYLPVQDSRFKEELVFVLGAINDYLIAFFRGQVLVAMCDGVLYTVGFLVIGLPYAVLIGVVATCLTIIPFIGAFVTVALALVVALVQFGDWQHPAMVLGVFAVVQSLEGFVIQPKIMGDRVGLHPVVIIIALMAGTTLLGGLLGGILAIPLAAALRVVMFRYIWRQRADEPHLPAPATQGDTGQPGATGGT